MLVVSILGLCAALALAAPLARTSATIDEVRLALLKRAGEEPMGELHYAVTLTTGETLTQRMPIDFSALTAGQKQTLRDCGDLALAGAKAREGLE